MQIPSSLADLGGFFDNLHNDRRNFWKSTDHHCTDSLSKSAKRRLRFYHQVGILTFHPSTDIGNNSVSSSSLCAADCLFCMLVLPFMAGRYIQGAWIHGDGFFCTFVPFIQYGNVGVSLLCIAMITINRYSNSFWLTLLSELKSLTQINYILNRYIMIAHHSVYARIYKKNWIILMLVFCWLFSFGFQLPTLFKVWGKTSSKFLLTYDLLFL